MVEPLVASALASAQVTCRLRDGLASFRVPRSVSFATLPRDDNGKIAKRRLREPF